MATAAFTQQQRGQAVEGPGDLRPILPRTSDNAWERTERVRAALHADVERLCRQRGMRALVLQSPPYVSPAWVKFETWSPRGEPCLTARAAFTIQLHTLPHHVFETLYTVEWERFGSKRALAQLHDLDETHVAGLLDLLMDSDGSGPIHRRVRRLLRPQQVRQQWWQFLRPANRITTVGRDWMTTGSVTAIVAGLWLLIVAAGDSTGGADLAEVPASYDVAGPSTPPAVVDDSAAMTAPAGSAIVPLDADGTATLEPGDAVFDDGRYYDARSLHLSTPGQVTIALRSSAFDTVLMVGRLGASGFEQLAINDDVPDDGTNSRVTVDLEAGEYVVLFTAYGPQQGGPYDYSASVS